MRTSLLALLLITTAPGCKFSASASGDVKTGGDVDANADASLQAKEQPPAPPPQANEAITYREGKLDYEGTINFEYDKAALRDDDSTQKTLKEFAAFLEKHADVSIEIEGHTDSRGSDDYNRDLSDRRAASVRSWLVEHGIDEQRLTAVGKGEDDPSVPEPPECEDKKPKDTSPCEESWATNRRVVFQVTGGKQTLEKPPEPEPIAEPIAEPAPAPRDECPWLWGGHLNLIGPNAWVGVAGAVQPGLCWLEPSLGLSLGFGGIDDENPPINTTTDGRYLVLNLPLRARIWFMDRHSLIGDVGLGLSHYWVSSEMTDRGGVSNDYSRNAFAFMAHLGVGYGFRPNGAQAGPRLAAVIGGNLPFGSLGDSSISGPATFNAIDRAALQDGLDTDSDNLLSLEPYAEISLGWLF